MNYLREDVIVALSTATGKSAIAVIRLSGQNSFEVVNKVFKTNSKPQRQVKYGYIMDGLEKKDEVMSTFFKAPFTYTGENMVEISAHGNPVIIDEILNLLYKNGASHAEPGEFTYRAFLNGKMDLTKAESVCALIASKTALSAKAALNNISGKFSQKIKSIADALTNLRAFMEAGLDYPQEDITFLSGREKLLRFDSCIKDAKELLNSYKVSKILRNGLKAVIIGKPNAGKSSLLNAVLGKNRAIVTDVAGTTTDTIEETIDCHGLALTVIDTAGIRDHAENSIEFLGQEKTKETIGEADMLLLVFDSSAELDQNDVKITELINNSDLKIPVIGVLNKSDLTAKLNPPLPIAAAKLVKISAKTGAGISDLLNWIKKIAGVCDAKEDCLMINSRHFVLLQKALESLTRARRVLVDENADEIACFEASQAQEVLNEILGINIKQNILDTIFSTFCVGK